MDDRNFQLAEQLVHPSYIRLAQNSLNKRQKVMKELLTQRQLPNQPLDQLTIRYILDSFALMDSNNFDHKVGVGERQSRIFSRMVEERHYHMGHGIGRSGDIMANQPKAAGSSLMLQLTKYLTVSALHELNYEFVKEILPLPLATGMSLTMALLTLHEQKPERKYVIWSRIDQKTCLKAVHTANLTPVIVQLKLEGDVLCTDLEAIEHKIKQVGPQNVLTVMSTTSTFAPRVPDRVDEIALIAKKYGVYHVINNAYGIWCSKIAHTIKQAYNKGQCTVVVQSTDKNFMVPVGGSFIFCQNSFLLTKISAKYPGRASGSPMVDLFITLLSMGKQTIKQLKTARKANYQEMLTLAKQFSEKHQCRVLTTPSNTISIGMHLTSLKEQADVTTLGSILYSKRVMGHRIMAATDKISKVGTNSFKNYGSHSDAYPFLPYVTFACAVGTMKEEVVQFFVRLQDSWKQLTKKIKKMKIQKSLEVTGSKEEEKQKNNSVEKKFEKNEPEVKIFKEQQSDNNPPLPQVEVKKQETMQESKPS